MAAGLLCVQLSWVKVVNRTGWVEEAECSCDLMNEYARDCTCGIVFFPKDYRGLVMDATVLDRPLRHNGLGPVDLLPVEGSRRFSVKSPPRYQNQDAGAGEEVAPAFFIAPPAAPETSRP